MMPELPIHHEKASKYAWLKRRAPDVIADYRNAQTRGQFLESLFAIHTLIEDALSCRFSEEEGKELTLLEMAERVIPFQAPELADLHRARGRLAHPREAVGSGEIQALAVQFVDLVIQVWPELLGRPVPWVAHLPLVESEHWTEEDQSLFQAQIAQLEEDLAEGEKTIAHLQQLLEKKQREIEKRKDKPARPAGEAAQALSDLPWLRLLVGLLLLLPLPVILGFGIYTWALIPGAWSWQLVAGVAGLILGFLGLFNLARFLRALRLLPLIAILSTLLVIATLIFIPGTDQNLPWSARAGAGLSNAIDAWGNAIGSYTTLGLDLGNALAGRVDDFWPDGTASSGEPVSAPAATATEDLLPTPAATAQAQETPAPAATETE
jgi:hypothetical protein